jgi:hypothetical protein
VPCFVQHALPKEEPVSAVLAAPVGAGGTGPVVSLPLLVLVLVLAEDEDEDVDGLTRRPQQKTEQRP